MSNVQDKRHKPEEAYLGEASSDSLSTVHPFLLQFGGSPFCAAGTLKEDLPPAPHCLKNPHKTMRARRPVVLSYSVGVGTRRLNTGGPSQPEGTMKRWRRRRRRQRQPAANRRGGGSEARALGTVGALARCLPALYNQPYTQRFPASGPQVQIQH